MAAVYITCPSCATQYSSERLGIAIPDFAPKHITMGCSVCRAIFDAVIMPTPVPGWFARVILGRKPSPHTVDTTIRG